MFRDARDSDLTLPYVGARIGLERGWSHIYQLDLQREFFASVRPGAAFGSGERFVSPPPLAWLVVPLTALGPVDAFCVWLAVSLLALVAAWWLAAPAAGWTRPLWLLAALAWYPVLYSLALGQPIPLVLLSVAACWRLAQSGRSFWAGAVLGLSGLKPQLTIALPLALLAAGHWRIAAGWLATTAVLVVASLVAIGTAGLDDYRSLLAAVQAIPNNRYFTLAYVIGPGPLSYAAQVLVIGVGAAGGYLNRGASVARLIALGLVGSTLGASHWHLDDFAILVVAAWLFSRDPAPGWQRAWLLLVAVTAELAWALGPLPILIAVAGWFVFLVVRAPRRLAPTAS